MGDRSYRVQPVKCRGMIVKACENSVLFFDDTHLALYYVPFSRVMEWKFLGDVSDDLQLYDLREDDPVEFDLPYWLLERENAL